MTTETSNELELVTMNGLKRVVNRLYEDCKKIDFNSMAKVDDLVDAFRDALIKERGIF